MMEWMKRVRQYYTILQQNCRRLSCSVVEDSFVEDTLVEEHSPAEGSLEEEDILGQDNLYKCMNHTDIPVP
jgi:hypothetical protein